MRQPQQPISKSGFFRDSSTALVSWGCSDWETSSTCCVQLVWKCLSCWFVPLPMAQRVGLAMGWTSFSNLILHFLAWSGNEMCRWCCQSFTMLCRVYAHKATCFQNLALGNPPWHSYKFSESAGLLGQWFNFFQMVSDLDYILDHTACNHPWVPVG